MNLKLVFLFAQYMPYFQAGIKDLVENHDAEVLLISWKKKGKHPEQYFDKHPRIKHVYKEDLISYSKDGVQISKLTECIKKYDPKFIYSSGWMDKEYLKVCRIFRRTIPVVCGLDAQYFGKLKQKLATVFLKAIFKRTFSHMWVAGHRQFEYAKRLGFKNNQIITNVLSCDVELFNSIFEDRQKETSLVKSKKKIVFIGRDSPEKNLVLLIQAFSNIKPLIKDWELILIGCQHKPSYPENIIGVGYKTPQEIRQILLNCDASILPSKKEAWGVVLHEYACAGLPIIVSDACGAITDLLIHGYNGFIFQNDHCPSLEKMLIKLCLMSPLERKEMGEKSHRLSSRISPQHWTSQVMSLLI